MIKVIKMIKMQLMMNMLKILIILKNKLILFNPFKLHHNNLKILLLSTNLITLARKSLKRVKEVVLYGPVSKLMLHLSRHEQNPTLLPQSKRLT